MSARSIPSARPCATRRRLLHGMVAGACAALAAPLRAASQPVVVLTSYPDEVVSRIEAAFEKAHPGQRLQVVWRMPHDALPYLRQPGQGGVDVYWTASPRNFATLKAEGAWRSLDSLEVDRRGLPAVLGNTPLSDPDGRYLATEMAGYGFAVNPEALARRGVSLPGDWDDLADPRLAGALALPIPARVGFAPVMVEIVLQAYGWERGWALWSEIAGNAVLIDRGSTFVADEVAAGRVAVGLSIDFFVAATVANGAPVRFLYPRHGGVNPGRVAVTAGAPNSAGAKAFVEFVLSPAGQAILADPDIRKLPVRPAVYASLPAGYPNLFELAAVGGYGFDGRLAQPRLGLTAALFQQQLVAPHAEVAALWRRVHAAEARQPAGAAVQAVAGARRALAAPLASEAEAADEALRRRFRSRVEGADATALEDVEEQWRRRAAARRAEAARLLAEAGA